jgi:hypothetical protein
MIGEVAFLAYQNNQLQKQVSLLKTTSTASPSPIATTDPMANWKTYTDSSTTFKYPDDWKIVVTTNKSNEFISLTKSDPGQPKVYLEDGTSQDASYGINISIAQNKVDVPKDSKPYLVDNVSGYEFTEGAAPSSGPETEVVINNNSKIYLFTYGAMANVDTHTKYLGVFDQILSTFKFTDTENIVSTITFSNGNLVAFNKIINSASGYTTDIQKISVDEYSISTQFSLKYYASLPQQLTSDTFTDSNGNDAGSGYYYNPNPTTTNGNKFTQSIYYYNPIAITKSGKYSFSVSSPMSTSCIYSYPNNSGFVVFSPLVPNASADACDFVAHLSNLTFSNK